MSPAPGLAARPRPTRAQLDSVKAALARNSAEVAGLSRRTMARMAPILDAAQREVARDLAKWLEARKEGGELRFTAQRYRSLLVALHGSLETIKQIDPAMAKALEDMGASAGQLAVDHTIDEIARLSKVFEGESVRIPIKLAAVVTSGQSYLIPRFETSAARYAGGIADDIKRELAIGLVRKESVYELTERLVRHGGPRGEVALRGIAGTPGARTEVIAEGLFARYRHWAIRIARTEASSAYSVQAHQAQWQAKKYIPDLKRRWDATNDARMCTECGRLDGEVVEFGEPFSNGDTDAPAHPNCMCRVGAWRDSWDALLKETEGEDSQESTSSPVPTEPQSKYPGAEQIPGIASEVPGSPERKMRELEYFELSQLHNERLHIFDGIGGSIFSKDGGRDYVELTPREAKMLKDRAVTHNHPVSRGSFSLDDISLAITNNASSIRAIGRSVALKGNEEHANLFTMSRPAKGWPSIDVVSDLYAKYGKSVRRVLGPRVDAGKLQPEVADAIHNHIVWKQVARDLDLPYNRTRVN